MKFPSSRHLFLTALALLLATNAFVLAGAAYNRGGEPQSLINLTERELSLPYRLQEENSGLSLALEWRTLGRDKKSDSYSGWGSPAWFNEEKLRELGFSDKELAEEDFVRRPLPKKAFIVLELDGKAYQEARSRAQLYLEQEEAKTEADEQEIKWARERLRKERLIESRLFAVDAGLDPERLRQKYPDTSHFLIGPGQVTASAVYNDRAKEKYHGSISGLSVENIHVPLGQRQIFLKFLQDDTLEDNDSSGPRYQITLAYGKRFEPWIESASSITGNRD
ncbi:MAG: DUF4824 family protein [Thermodesulfobacteriota bacterium]